MRVLHVYSGNLYGGIERILVTIARQERRNGASVHEFALCFEGRLSEEFRAAGAPAYALAAVRMSRPQTAREARRALQRLLARERFDRVVCHAPWSQAIFGGVVRRAGVPLVFWAHDVMTGQHWTERLARRVAPDLVVGNSAFTLTTLPRLYPGAPSVVVYAPVEVDERPAAARAGLRASLDTAADAVVIVQASRSEAWKGHLMLVDALASLRDLPGWIWWQVGGAQRPAEMKFLEHVRDAAGRAGIGDRVRWLGERSDVPNVLAAADIYCQPNLRPEPFGIAFIEALAAGLPVVTVNAGGPAEIVDERCGVLVDADCAAVAAALRRLVIDRAARARLAAAAPARARELCDVTRQLQRLDAALAQMTPAGAHA